MPRRTVFVSFDMLVGCTIVAISAEAQAMAGSCLLYHPMSATLVMARCRLLLPEVVTCAKRPRTHCYARWGKRTESPWV